MNQEKNVPALGAIAASLYVSFQLIANVLSTKIALLPWLNWSIDGGTVIYPLTFTLRDFVHKTLGKKSARQIVVLAAAINLAMALLFILIGKVKPDPTWQYQVAYEKILLPVWRITLGSIIAQVISELLDTEIFSVAYRKMDDVAAVLFSNSVSLVADSFIFAIIAFAFFLPWITVWQIIFTNIIVKTAMSLLSAPSIKLVPRTVEFEQI